MAENNRANRVLVRSEMSKMSDRWAWTLNNPGEWRPRWSDIGQVAYAIYQVERGENGTEHLKATCASTSASAAAPSSACSITRPCTSRPRAETSKPTRTTAPRRTRRSSRQSSTAPSTPRPVNKVSAPTSRL